MRFEDFKEGGGRLNGTEKKGMIGLNREGGVGWKGWSEGWDFSFLNIERDILGVFSIKSEWRKKRADKSLRGKKRVFILHDKELSDSGEIQPVLHAYFPNPVKFFTTPNPPPLSHPFCLFPL